MYTHKHILTNSWARARGPGSNKLPTRSRFVCLPECPFVSHTHIIGHDPLSYPKSQWLKMHSCRLIQERKIFPPKSSRIVTSNTQHPRSLYSDDVRPHNKRTRARMHPCTHALATHKHSRTQHTSTQARTQSTQPATDGTHSRLIFCSPARQLRDGAKAVAAAGCRLLSLRNTKAHEIALSKKRETGVLGIRRIEQGRNRLRRSQNFGEAGLVHGKGFVRSGTACGWRRRNTVETKGAPDPTHIN